MINIAKKFETFLLKALEILPTSKTIAILSLVNLFCELVPSILYQIKA